MKCSVNSLQFKQTINRYNYLNKVIKQIVYQSMLNKYWNIFLMICKFRISNFAFITTEMLIPRIYFIANIYIMVPWLKRIWTPSF